MKKIFVFSVLLASLIFAVSCSNNKKNEEKKDSVVKEEVVKEISVKEGGIIKNSDESISIKIPGLALDNNTKITMRIYDAKDYKGTEGKDIISKVVEFEPSGIIFKKPVIITMKSLKKVENKIITAAVFNEKKGEWSYSPKGAAVKIAGYDEGGDPIMQSAGGDPIMLSAGGDPIMMDDGGDPIMLSAGGDPIMITAGGDPIMHSDGGDPIMMTTGHFTAYAFILINDEDIDEEGVCAGNPCLDVANSTKECIDLGTGDYECGCNEGYHWWGAETGCTDKFSLGNICTGQNKCYDHSGEIECPAAGEDYYGQDAQYAALGKCTPQSFMVQTISGDNIVVDNNTGLMWQQTPPETTYTWENAISYCDDLTYAGYDDWRLPSPKEFHTISDNGRYSPAFDTTYFPSITNSDSSLFWTSYECKSNTSSAYYVTYDIAFSYVQTKTNTYNVMCVRGNELPEPVFRTQTISGEVVVTDSITGLMWQKEYVSGTQTWQQALKYCEDLSYAGYTDWRLPNKNEATTLFNYNKTANPYSGFPDMPGEFFWTSSTLVNAADEAWGMDFYLGYVGYNGKQYANSVRCVR